MMGRDLNIWVKSYIFICSPEVWTHCAGPAGELIFIFKMLRLISFERENIGFISGLGSNRVCFNLTLSW